jgi:hypothetical protein
MPIAEPARTVPHATNLATAACAASAGAHAALVPQHLHESPALGVAFAVAVVALAIAAVALIAKPGDRRAHHAAALLLGGLIVAYALSVTAGIPWLAGDPEPVDPVALATKCVETAGALAALLPATTMGGRGSPAIKEAR